MEQITHRIDEDRAWPFPAEGSFRASSPYSKPLFQRLVAVLIDEFLGWCKKHRAPDTYRWYNDRLESFCKSIDLSLTVDKLKKHHVQKWADSAVSVSVRAKRRRSSG